MIDFSYQPSDHVAYRLDQLFNLTCIKAKPCEYPEGGQGVPPPHPLKNHKNIVFLSNTGPDPLNNHKDTKPAFNVEPSSAHQ